MALPPIQIQLSKFEQIEILRQEIELREEELKQNEKTIRQIVLEIERQNYLQTVHPLFTQLQPPAEAANLPQYQANRDALAEAIQAMKTALDQLEAETKGQAPPPGARGAAGAAAGARRMKFDTFDSFKNQRPGGAKP